MFFGSFAIKYFFVAQLLFIKQTDRKDLAHLNLKFNYNSMVFFLILFIDKIFSLDNKEFRRSNCNVT